MSTVVALVGLGRMGLPMCANLVAAGHEVHAADRRAELARAARAVGARWHGEARTAAGAADVLVTMLPGSAELRAALLGAGGALAALREGGTWIDMGSTSPSVAAEVRARAGARGIGVLDAPVTGGPAQARDGTLGLLVGGDAALLARHRALLGAVADPGRIRHVGGPGAGHTTKLLVNLLWFGQALATAEALLVGAAAGIDLEALHGALADSPASSAFIERDLDGLLDGDHRECFGLDRCCEELDAVTALAGELGLDLELGRLVARIHSRALKRFGPRDGELLGVALLEEEAGIALRRRPAGERRPYAAEP